MREDQASVKNQPLSGKVAIVTGASRGIGQAIATELAKEGARLSLVSRSGQALRASAKEVKRLGAECLVSPADVAHEDQVTKIVTATAERFGQIDILVNGAGFAAFKPLEETSEAEWDAMLDANLKGAFLCMKQTIPYLLRQGRGDIVNIASVAGLQPFLNSSAYCASKFGIIGLSKAVSLEFRARGIRVITICPGAVNTSLWDTVSQPPERSRMLKPEEVARAVVAAITLSGRSVVDMLTLTPPEGIL